MSGNHIYGQLNNAHEVSQDAKDLKTLAEHDAIIRIYSRTGYLDRQDALKKYQRFNEDHPDYLIFMNAKAATGSNRIVPLESMTDIDIVGNLSEQFEYLVEKNALKEWRRNG